MGIIHIVELSPKMKVVIAFGFLCLVAVYGNVCMNNDPTKCTHSCPDGETKVCEHDVCTCGVQCTMKSDCADCPSHTDPHNHHQIQEEKHCVDGACVCMMPHQGPGGHMPPQH